MTAERPGPELPAVSLSQAQARVWVVPQVVPTVRVPEYRSGLRAPLDLDSCPLPGNRKNSPQDTRSRTGSSASSRQSPLIQSKYMKPAEQPAFQPSSNPVEHTAGAAIPQSRDLAVFRKCNHVRHWVRAKVPMNGNAPRCLSPHSALVRASSRQSCLIREKEP